MSPFWSFFLNWDRRRLSQLFSTKYCRILEPAKTNLKIQRGTTGMKLRVLSFNPTRKRVYLLKLYSLDDHSYEVYESCRQRLKKLTQIQTISSKSKAYFNWQLESRIIKGSRRNR
jgi:hypothetical protein